MTKRIIEETKLRQLLEDSAVLNALLSGGVDNWDWYEESLEHCELPDEDSLTKYPIYSEEPQNVSKS